MGVVYSPDQVEQGYIPNAPVAHQRAAEFLMDELVELDLPSLVYGSVAVGTPTRRSDLDLLVLSLDDELMPTLDFMQWAETQVDDRWHVKVESNIIPFSHLSPPSHTVDPLLLIHLRAAEIISPYVYQKPVERVSETTLYPVDSISIIRDYLGAKHKKFTRAKTSTDPDTFKVMQRVLELPKSIATKLFVLSRFEEQDHTSRQQSSIIDELFSAAEQSTAAIDSLSRLDEEYNEILVAAIGGLATSQEYSQWIYGNFDTALKLAVQGVAAAIITTNRLGSLNANNL